MVCLAGQWNEAVEMASQEVAREKADQYEDAIQKIKTVCGCTNALCAVLTMSCIFSLRIVAVQCTFCVVR